MLFIENDKKYSNSDSSTRVSSALLEFEVTRRNAQLYSLRETVTSY